MVYSPDSLIHPPILSLTTCIPPPPAQVQSDAPEDRAMYIHRVGRTARYNAGGRALLLLLPSEEKRVVGVLTEVARVCVFFVLCTFNIKKKSVY